MSFSKFRFVRFHPLPIHLRPCMSDTYTGKCTTNVSRKLVKKF